MSEGLTRPLLPLVLGDNGLEFMAGEVRALEMPGTAAIHTIFLREHNRIASALSAMEPKWSDEELYQMARRQSII